MELRTSDFDRVVFVFAKDRLENWIEFLLTGSTDEAQEGPRVKDGKRVAAAAKTLAQTCIRTTRRNSASTIAELVMPKLASLSRTNEGLICRGWRIHCRLCMSTPSSFDILLIHDHFRGLSPNSANRNQTPGVLGCLDLRSSSLGRVTP